MTLSTETQENRLEVCQLKFEIIRPCFGWYLKINKKKKVINQVMSANNFIIHARTHARTNLLFGLMSCDN